MKMLETMQGEGIVTSWDTTILATYPMLNLIPSDLHPVGHETRSVTSFTDSSSLVSSQTRDAAYC